MMPTSAPARSSTTGAGTCVARRLELARQPVEVVDVVVRPLAVRRLLVVAGAAREVRRHAGARAACGRGCRRRRRPCSGPSSPSSLQRLGVEHLAAVDAACRDTGTDRVIQLFMPRSRSLSTKTGVWNRSARSKASIANSKHSSTDAGSSSTCRVSPCDRTRGERMSPCAVRVGRPVLGPMRWMSKITAGISA